MTRINCTPVAQIHTKQLHGEYVELPRVFVHMKRRIEKGKPPTDIPAAFTHGPGHVTFFFDKLEYLEFRYSEICTELCKRGFNLKPRSLHAEFKDIPSRFWKGWTPTPEAIAINKARIDERLKSMQERGIA